MKTLQCALSGLALWAIVFLCWGQADPNQAAKTKGQARSPSARDKTLIDREKAVWETVKNKQVDAFRKYFADHYSGVYGEGIKGISQEVEDVRNVDLKDYSLTDMKVVFPNKGTAILTYKATVQGSLKGQDISGTYYASSVWMDQDGKWLAVLHTEAKAQ